MTIFLIFIILLGWLFSYLLDAPFILYLAVFIAFFQSFLSYWYSDKIVLYMTKSKPVEKKDYPELYRIVENLAITAGLPMPKIYILNEKQPNAFATGRNPNNAVVAVTSGLLEKLEKSELEGVIAHELAHIGNRDILLQSVVVALVGFISIVSDFFIRLRSINSNNRNQLSGIFTVISLIFIILAPIIATLIHLAISRKREFLADATGALITRYPEGLARALEKIAYDVNTMKVASNFNAHLFIASPFKEKQQKNNWLIKLFMTHPPVEERIKILREMSI